MNHSTILDNTPILAGVAAIRQKTGELNAMDEAVVLMQKAVQAAAKDAGNENLLQKIDRIGVPQGFWQYSDPGRLVAEAVGSPQAHTCLAAIGISQQALINDACQQIADGRAAVTVVTGGEAKYRSLQGKIQNNAVTDTDQQDQQPDHHWKSDDRLWSVLEEQRGLLMPVEFYALIESAICTASGRSMAEHRRYLGELYASFSEKAASEPSAWFEQPLEAWQISEPSDKNPYLAFPYTKKHNSQWNVNQSAALIFCSAAKARELGLDPSRWIFPLACAQSDYMLPLSERPQLHRHRGMAECARAVFDVTGLGIKDIDFADLYSCFPSAVQSHALDIGLPSTMPLTQTGGMAFYGGPLNNFVMQSTAVMVQLLRRHPGKTGLVSCISGINNKQGLSLYSSKPPTELYQTQDVTDKTRAAMPPVASQADYQGSATLLAATVVFSNKVPSHAFAIGQTPNGKRVVCRSSEPALMALLQTQDKNGSVIDVCADGQFSFRE